MTEFPENYETIQLKLCSDSRRNKGTVPGRSGGRLVKNIAEAAPYFKEHGKDYCILDIGAGDGLGLDAWRTHGYEDYQLHGIEYVGERVRTAKSFGLDVVQGAAEDLQEIAKLQKWPGVFNIFCSHTLEHTVDQEKALKGMQAVGNLIYLIVPTEFKAKSPNSAHPSVIRNMEQLKKHFDKATWLKLREEYRFNLEYEGVLVYIRR